MKFLHLHPLAVLGGIIVAAFFLFSCISYWILN